MPKFAVNYQFGATIIIEADSEDEAIEQVEEMPVDSLFDSNCRRGFEVLGAEEL